MRLCRWVTYKRRWDIEAVFKPFRVNLEDAHVCGPDRRITTLASILIITFCFTYKQGAPIVLDQPHLLKLKKHGDIPKDVFRIGADMIHSFFAISYNLRENTQLCLLQL